MNDAVFLCACAFLAFGCSESPQSPETAADRLTAWEKTWLDESGRLIGDRDAARIELQQISEMQGDAYIASEAKAMLDTLDQFPSGD